jgi:acyl-CoA thioesterase FadM
MARIEIKLPEKWVFATEIPVRISDINRGRHLGHDAVLPITEEARVRVLSSLGYAEEHIDGSSFLVVDAGIIYKKQGYYGQTLKVAVGLTDFSSRGFDMVFLITDAALTRSRDYPGQDRHLFYTTPGSSSSRSRRVPPQVRGTLDHRPSPDAERITCVRDVKAIRI